MLKGYLWLSQFCTEGTEEKKIEGKRFQCRVLNFGDKVRRTGSSAAPLVIGFVSLDAQSEIRCIYRLINAL